jgi:hypothetical protein
MSAIDSCVYTQQNGVIIAEFEVGRNPSMVGSCELWFTRDGNSDENWGRVQKRHFMLSRSSPHSASAIVSTVSQGTQESVRISMTVTFFPQVNDTSDGSDLRIRYFSLSAFLEAQWGDRLHWIQWEWDLRIKRGEEYENEMKSNWYESIRTRVYNFFTMISNLSEAGKSRHVSVQGQVTWKHQEKMETLFQD